MSFVLFETHKRCIVASKLCVAQIIISLHLYQNYYVYKNIANDETKWFDKKFEINTDTFLVSSNFNGHLLVHIRKFNGDFIKKEGVCMLTNQYQPLLELLGKKEKGIINLGQMRIRRTKCAVMVDRLDKGCSIQLRTIAISNLISRYICL